MTSRPSALFAIGTSPTGFPGHHRVGDHRHAVGGDENLVGGLDQRRIGGRPVARLEQERHGRGFERLPNCGQQLDRGPRAADREDGTALGFARPRAVAEAPPIISVDRQFPVQASVRRPGTAGAAGDKRAADRGRTARSPSRRVRGERERDAHHVRRVGHRIFGRRHHQVEMLRRNRADSRDAPSASVPPERRLSSRTDGHAAQPGRDREVRRLAFDQRRGSRAATLANVAPSSPGGSRRSWL